MLHDLLGQWELICKVQFVRIKENELKRIKENSPFSAGKKVMYRDSSFLVVCIYPFGKCYRMQIHCTYTYMYWRTAWHFIVQKNSKYQSPFRRNSCGNSHLLEWFTLVSVFWVVNSKDVFLKSIKNRSKGYMYFQVIYCWLFRVSLVIDSWGLRDLGEYTLALCQK